jgi:hypothetical protein
MNFNLLKQKSVIVNLQLYMENFNELHFMLFPVLQVGRDCIPFLFEKRRNHPSAF